jgi:Ni,Fe-hydrogenase I small subunit
LASYILSALRGQDINLPNRQSGVFLPMLVGAVWLSVMCCTACLISLLFATLQQFNQL